MFYNKGIAIAAAASLLVAAIAVSCSGTEGQDDTGLSLTVHLKSVPQRKDSQFFDIQASGAWILSLSFSTPDDDGWAWVDEYSGTGSSTGTLHWTENPGKESRSVTLTLETATGRVSSTMVQAGKGKDPGELSSDPVPDWLELPAVEGSGRYFITHDMNLSSRKVRNFSLLLDSSAKISVWVAYPLNKTLISSGSRTDAWGLDPKVPAAYQPVITKAFKGGYERGHQIPSADRYAKGANEQTCYGTNITPQLGVLNENAWAELEGLVRNWSFKLDTLYVVTGADIKGSTKYATDNDGKKITVPVGYFKALLGYKRNASSLAYPGQVGGYLGIGFYFEHRSYPSDKSSIMSQSMTIDELEARLGYDFFVNLTSRISASQASQVEASKSSWWSSNY